MGVRLAAEILVDARRAAGLSQRQLAARAGVTQPAVALYERGRRQPSFATLRKLVAAAGFELAVDLVEMGPLRRLVAERREDIARLAAESGLSRVSLFGSVARGDERPDSDVDLLVTLGDNATLLSLIGFEDAVADLLGASVDVVPEAAIKEAYARQVLAEAVPL